MSLKINSVIDHIVAVLQLEVLLQQVKNFSFT